MIPNESSTKSLWPKQLTGEDGSALWKDEEGNFHREDGPAVIELDGTEHWFKHGLLHRDGGPAVIYPGGTEYWYQNNYLHREDGPAVTYSGDIHAWYVHQVCARTPEEFQQLTGISDEELTFLLLKYGDIS